MGDIGEEVGLQRLDAAQLPHHLVEIQDHHVQVVQLVGGVDGGHIDGEVPLRHLSGGRGQLLHRLFEGIFHQVTDQQRHAQGHQDPVDQHRMDQDDIVERQAIYQQDQPLVDAGGQHQPAQNHTEQGQGKPADPGKAIDGVLYPAHFSTAL